MPKNNITLLENELKTDCNNSFTLFNLGNSYYVLNDKEKAKEYYELSFNNIKPYDSFLSLLFRNYCACLLDLCEYKKALYYCNYGIVNYDDYPDLYFIKGQIYFETRFYKEAEKCFLKCITFKPEMVKFTSTSGVCTYMSYEYLTGIYENVRDIKDSIKYSILVLKECFNIDEALHLYDLYRKSSIQANKIINNLKNELCLSDNTIFLILKIRAEKCNSEKNFKEAFEIYLKLCNMDNSKNLRLLLFYQVLNLYDSYLKKSGLVDADFKISELIKKAEREINNENIKLLPDCKK